MIMLNVPAVGNSETGRVEVVDVLPELDIVKILDIIISSTIPCSIRIAVLAPTQNTSRV